MDRIEQIEKAIKAIQDRFFYAETAPKSSMEVQILIHRVEILQRMKYQMICQLEPKIQSSSVPNLELKKDKTLFQTIWEVLTK